MQSKFLFTKQKFLSLTLEKQHKHAAFLIRSYYERLVNGEHDISPDLYNKWQSWLGENSFKSINLEELSNHYHKHMQKAKIHIKEPFLLPKLLQGDRSKALKPLKWSIYLDNLRSAFNVGSIIRTTEAFSLGKIIFGEKSPNLKNKQVQDVSMETHSWVSTEENTSLDDLPRPIIALETIEGAIPHYDYPFPEEGTLVLGNEEYGCSKNTLAKADAFISIPLYGRKNSLNVANAFSIVAETIRRRSNHVT